MTAEQPTADQRFHLADDLGETKNPVGDRPDVVAELKRRLAEISARDNDAVAKD